MNILIGLVPAALWGLMPLIAGKTGGKPINQLVGNTYGALIVAVIIALFRHPQLSSSAFIWCLLSGACWACGQLSQYWSFPEIGVSRAMPISTGAQLVGTSVVGVLFFGEWATGFDKLFGFAALILIIVGILFTTKTDKIDASQGLDPAVLRRGTTVLLLGTIGYVGFSALPQIPVVDGWSAFFPQAIGMVLASAIISIFYRDKNEPHPLVDKRSFANIAVGIDFGIATAVYMYSTKVNGIATGFTLSQMSVIVSTLSGILLLGEKKSKKGLTYVTIGLVIVVIGGVITGSLGK
ncbi:GRP family sugar transporter [Lactobacillus sp. Sy-1]|uniref:GRP family sugar transporter n=1 Tax=Lactobacillus sp. Sy-1 TaxID=2109645 RepID=UPI001C5B2C1A|nr:GRP family sugar transporter [Lactobacillus sp. Sy-1]MBW1606123.1 ribose uptake protein RbsU [Lactobacillus sp. Sy-1]